MDSVNSSAKQIRKRELIRVGGVTPFTTIDYPGQLAAVLYLQGCPWRCHYCHNSELLERRDCPRIAWTAVLEFLERRKNLIDAVVFSGGEPTLQPGLGEALLQVKDMGYKIGLHSAGIYPRRLQTLLPLVDWVGLDIKASVDHYAKVTGVGNSGLRAWQSLRLVVAAGVDYEVRTTLHPRLIDRDHLLRLVDELGRRQVRNYALQECVAPHCLNPDYRVEQKFPLDASDIDAIAASFASFELRKAG